MNGHEMEQYLLEVLGVKLTANDPNPEKVMTNLCTFEHAGILSNNPGLYVRMEDGSEFQVSIVKAR